MATPETALPGSDAAGPSPEQIALEARPRIERIVHNLSRRYYLRPEDEQDLRQDVWVKIAERDYEVVRRFIGKSSFPTYLTMVITNHFRDWRNHHWGKRRPSAEAERLGPVAIRLEILLRSGQLFHEACRELRDNCKVPLSEAELADLAAQLPPWTPRITEGEDVLGRLPSGGPSPEAACLEEERRRVRQRVMKALEHARKKLPVEDELIVKLRFEKGQPFVDIARGLKEPQRPFYRRVERILRTLRTALEAEGIRREEVAELFASGEDQDLFGVGARSLPKGPSNEGG